MRVTSAIAIYVLFWVLSAFLVMPFGLRTTDEAGETRVPGQADSAPANFEPRRVAIRATVLALVLFALFYANYAFGWIDMRTFDFYSPRG